MRRKDVDAIFKDAVENHRVKARDAKSQEDDVGEQFEEYAIESLGNVALQILQHWSEEAAPVRLEPASVRADPVAYWAVQGGAGWLNLLRQLQREGLAFHPQAVRDMEGLRAVLDNIIRKTKGETVSPLPGGMSGAVAAHFSET